MSLPLADKAKSKRGYSISLLSYDKPKREMNRVDEKISKYEAPGTVSYCTVSWATDHFPTVKLRSMCMLEALYTSVPSSKAASSSSYCIRQSSQETIHNIPFEPSCVKGQIKCLGAVTLTESVVKGCFE
jgi:hypothetical protein